MSAQQARPKLKFVMAQKDNIQKYFVKTQVHKNRVIFKKLCQPIVCHDCRRKNEDYFFLFLAPGVNGILSTSADRPTNHLALRQVSSTFSYVGLGKNPTLAFFLSGQCQVLTMISTSLCLTPTDQYISFKSGKPFKS